MKDLEIVRSKACAFFEFQNLDSARRAIAASLPPSQGGEGGVWIDCGDSGSLRCVLVYVYYFFLLRFALRDQRLFILVFQDLD